MGRKAKQRRQSHSSTWHWKQTDCWYFTQPGTKKRVALFDERGERIRGEGNKVAAEVALAREKLSWTEDSGEQAGSRGPWIVARVCSEYLQYCERGLANGTISRSHRDNTTAWLPPTHELPVENFARVGEVVIPLQFLASLVRLL